MSSQFDLIVIGAGPGGYVAAIRAAQLGMNVACIEKEKPLGGTCLRVGCIPSKALLESSDLYEQAKKSFGKRGVQIGKLELDLPQMLAQKDETVSTLTRGIDGLFKKNKISRFQGHAKFLGPGQIQVNNADGESLLTSRQILIATGSVPTTLPGIELDGERVVSSTEALCFQKVPESLVVIGAGAIGLELGSVWRRLGSQVTVLEYLDRILPGMDGELAKQALKTFQSQGLQFQLRAKVTGVSVNRKSCDVHVDGMDSIRCERVLVAVGRKPNTQDLGLEKIGVTPDKRGFIPVGKHYQTSAEGVYAIGDVIGGAMLAHKAEEEGIACVEYLSTGYGHVNYQAIPAIVYTNPEVASVGSTEEQLKEQKIEYKVGTFPFAANGRARAIGHAEGLVKILADARTDRILGAHIIGPHAGDLIAEVAVAIEFSASSEDLARASHAHPTLAEAIKEAAMAVAKRTIHM
ncbi:MAG: dihydrolipoyl dehydrogenase [Planctomycetaceae bacterium]|nr:dihydrolipoyl dehydrogenase [Planctomycetaceae bacterium]